MLVKCGVKHGCEDRLDSKKRFGLWRIIIFKRAAIYELFDKMLMPNRSTRKGRRSGQQKPDDLLSFSAPWSITKRPTMQDVVCD